MSNPARRPPLKACDAMGQLCAVDSTGPDRQQIVVRDRGFKGDLNGDGIVNADDLEILYQQWGECPCCAGDLNGDGIVDIFDALILISNYD